MTTWIPGGVKPPGPGCSNPTRDIAYLGRNVWLNPLTGPTALGRCHSSRYFLYFIFNIYLPFVPERVPSLATSEVGVLDWKVTIFFLLASHERVIGGTERDRERKRVFLIKLNHPRCVCVCVCVFGYVWERKEREREITCQARIWYSSQEIERKTERVTTT